MVDGCQLTVSVISTDGICAKCRSRVVWYYVRQKWRNPKAVAVKALAESIPLRLYSDG